METFIKINKKIKFKNPILIEGLPGVGNVGRVAAGYLVNELKMKPFAELYSPHFLPLVILQKNSVVSNLKAEFHYKKTPKRDIIVLTGDSQSMTSDGHYEISDEILKFAKSLGVKEIITLGGFAEGKEVKNPRVIGAVNDEKLLKKYSKFNIDFGNNHPIGTIIGASGLLAGIAQNYKIDALCLMGETIGLPLLTDPVAADKILIILKKMLNLNIDLKKLENTIKEMEEKIGKTDKIHKKMLEQIPKGEEQIRYIG